MSDPKHLEGVTSQFAFPGKFVSAVHWGTGHIQDSYCVEYRDGGACRRYLMQRIAGGVFKDVPALMENIERVTAYMAAQLTNVRDRERRVLTLVRARDGRLWHEDVDGENWRAYGWVEGTHTYETVETAEQAFQAARAFGRFQAALAAMPGPRLHETIPDFHNTPKRLVALERAVALDDAGRAGTATREIEFALARRDLAGALMQANLPERITHNDTKLNNVLFDDTTGEGICVIDLDTVMPGLAPCDFGDMVRTATSPAPEDEHDLSRVTLRMPMFEALLRGYLSAVGGVLVEAEKLLLATAGKLITWEQGIRFLTDYLNGDRYYKVHREGHNLDRCRTQFKLVELMEQREDEMERLVRAALE